MRRKKCQWCPKRCERGLATHEKFCPERLMTQTPQESVHVFGNLDNFQAAASAAASLGGALAASHAVIAAMVGLAKPVRVAVLEHALQVVKETP